MARYPSRRCGGRAGSPTATMCACSTTAAALELRARVSERARPWGGGGAVGVVEEADARRQEREQLTGSDVLTDLGRAPLFTIAWSRWRPPGLNAVPAERSGRAAEPVVPQRSRNLEPPLASENEHGRTSPSQARRPAAEFVAGQVAPQRALGRGTRAHRAFGPRGTHGGEEFAFVVGANRELFKRPHGKSSASTRFRGCVSFSRRPTPKPAAAEHAQNPRR